MASVLYKALTNEFHADVLNKALYVAICAQNQEALHLLSLMV